MDREGLINFGDYVPPQQEKQIVPKPPTYEESLQDIMEGKKEIHVDPQYFPQKPDDLPPEYDDDEEIDYEYMMKIQVIIFWRMLVLRIMKMWIRFLISQK